MHTLVFVTVYHQKMRGMELSLVTLNLAALRFTESVEAIHHQL